MLQDLEAGKRTEVEALTGYVSAQGKLHGVPTPVCDTLSEIVRFRERATSLPESKRQ
jgi:2-dehydropantoate 2-reductase